MIFCDFDGTITERDNIADLVKHFKPEGWEPIFQDIMEFKISIREGVGALFALFPSSQKRELQDYVVNNAGIRQGFPELLEYCRKEHIEFFVTSGGIDFFLYPILAPYDIPKDHIFCNHSSFEGANIEILWPHPCDLYCNKDCGMCKTTVIRSMSAQNILSIVIGDSITDFEAAKLADVVFATKHLKTRCQELGRPYIPFETFHDVISHLQKEVITR